MSDKRLNKLIILIALIIVILFGTVIFLSSEEKLDDDRSYSNPYDLASGSSNYKSNSDTSKENLSVTNDIFQLVSDNISTTMSNNMSDNASYCEIF